MNGRHVVAKCGIDIGQTVFAEDVFTNILNVDDRTCCFLCTKNMKKFHTMP